MRNKPHIRFSLLRQGVPLLLQNEISECGLACIAMISSYHGHNIGIDELRNRVGGTTRGSSLSDIMSLADSCGLASRALRLEVEQIDSLRLPAVLHWNLDHFVVATAVSGSSITINDPATGRIVVPRSEVSDSFTGIALELFPGTSFQKRENQPRVRLSSLWSSIVGLKRSMFQIFALSAVLQLLLLIMPIMMQITVDHVLATEDFGFLNALAIGFGLLILIQALTSAVRSWSVIYLNANLDIQLMANVFRHLLRLPISYFENRFLGDLLSRFRSLKNIRELFSNGIVEATIDGLMAITTLIMMFVYNETLALIAMTAALLYAGGRFIFLRYDSQFKNEALVQEAKEQTSFMETVRGIQTVKLYSKENQREAIWHNHYTNALNSNIRLWILKAAHDVSNRLLFPIGGVLIVWWGAHEILRGSFTVGMLYAFYSYHEHFKQRAATLVDKVVDFSLVKVDLDRLSDVLLEPEETVDAHDDSDIRRIDSIEVRNVGYKFRTKDKFLFRNLSFSISEGESVAIVGPSGCGKTTVIKMMLGLIDPTEGQILYGGRALSGCEKGRLRKRVGSVMQEDALFSGSIAQNITLFDSQPNWEKLVRCAKHAAIHDDINEMPMGYRSLVGDMGSMMSGGQRQRILIARALYSEPEVLFLDEASSHLDVPTERQINLSLQDLKITRIQIAHRRETIDMADRIIDLSMVEPQAESIELRTG